LKSSSPISVAVIGLGWVATHRHIPIILRHPQLRLFGVVDKRPERLKDITAKYPQLNTSLSVDGEMPWGDDVQAVLIATDPFNHYHLAKKMLLAGKNVLIEKPLSMTPDEAVELHDISKYHGVSLCVVHNFQFARSTVKLQEMIRTGQLGDIISIEAIQFSNPHRRLPVWYEQLPYGLFYDESPHMFYMIEALAGGPVSRLSSTVIRRSGQSTPLSVTANYAAGTLPIRLSMNFEAALSEWHIVVMGSKGIGIVDIFRDILMILPNDGQHRAREIVTSSLSAFVTHFSGFFSSGLLLVGGKLFYGADVVWQHFIDEMVGIKISKEISSISGGRIVEMQHDLMKNSLTQEIPS